MSEDYKINIKLDGVKNAVDDLKALGNEASIANQKIKGKFNESTQSVNTFEKVASGAFRTVGSAMNAIPYALMFKAINMITDAFVSATKESIEFKTAIASVETIMQDGQKMTDELRKNLLDLSAQYGTKSSAQAKAYYEVLSAGIDDASEAMKVLKNANDLATGGLTDVNKVVGLLSGAYSLYGKEMATTSEAVDSLFRTAQLGRTNLDALVTTLGKALPIAKSMGLTFDEVGSNIATFSNAGNTTARSVTLLNALLTAINKNGKDLGPTMNAAAVKTDGLAVVMDRLQKRTGGSSEALTGLLKRQEAVIGAQVLMTQGMGAYNTQLDKYSDKAGEAAKASDKIISEDVSKQWQQLLSYINKAADGFGFITDAISGTLQYLTKFFIKDNTESGLVTQIKQAESELETFGELLKDLKNNTDDRGFLTIEQRNEIKDLEKDIVKSKVELDALRSALYQTQGTNSVMAGVATDVDKLTIKTKTLIAEIDKLSTHINTGFDMGPLERNIKIANLNKELEDTRKKITAINAASAEGGADPKKGKGGKTPLSDDQKKAAAKLAQERRDLEINLDNQLLQSKYAYYSKLSALQKESSTVLTSDEKAAFALRQENFTAATGKRLEDLKLQLAKETDAVKRSKIEQAIAETTTFGTEEKQTIDTQTEAAAATAKIEQRRAYYTQLKALDAEMNEEFTNEEIAKFEADIERYGAQESIKLAQMQAAYDAEGNEEKKKTMGLELQAAQRVAITKTEEEQKKKMINNGLAVANQAISAGLSFAKKGTRERKNLLRAQIIMDTATGAMRAWSEMGPWLGGAMATLITAQGLGRLKQVDEQNFATGGIINAGGSSINGDKVNASVNHREMILNMQQQRNIFDAIQTGNFGSGMSSELLASIRDEIKYQPERAINLDADRMNETLTTAASKRLG